MADSDPVPTPSSPASAADPSTPSPKTQHDLQPVAAKVAELNESQLELLSRLQGLKQDLQSWRTVLDTQVKTYKDIDRDRCRTMRKRDQELLELKSRLNSDLEQLTSDFQDLKTTLQKQQEEVTASLKNLGLNDVAETHSASQCSGTNDKVEAQDSSLDGSKELTHVDNDGEKTSLSGD